MHVIVLASQKGGSGKTTLAAHLAVAASAVGPSVAMIDTDPQRSLTAWFERREADTPQLVETANTSAAIGVLQEKGFGLLFVDTPPTITPQITRTIRLASLVLIPVRPSPVDVWAVGETVAICQGEGVPFAFALTQAVRGAGLTAQTIAALSEHGVVSPSIVHSRVVIAAAMAAGLTAQEAEPRNQAAQEVAGLLDFVRARLLASTRAKEHVR
jgi:chromosome partitioning protein